MSVNESKTSESSKVSSNGKNKRGVLGVLSVIAEVVLWLFVAICVFGVIIAVTAKRDSDGAANMFGYQLRFVQSDSMEKCSQTDVSAYKIKSIKVKSCVFVKKAPDDDEAKNNWYKSLEVGDVLTFRYTYGKQMTITHRIVDIEEKEGGGFIIRLEGDNKNSSNDVLTQEIDTSENGTNYIIGKVTGQSYALGLLVYALKKPVGLICIVIIPCAIVIIWEIVRIAGVFGKERKEKQKAEADKQSEEMERLRQQIAMLQRQNKDIDKKESETEEGKEI